MFRLKVRLVPEGRRVCEKGHLLQKHRKTCLTCWYSTTSAKGRAVERKRCLKGHLIGIGHRKFCLTCYCKDRYKKLRQEGADSYTAKGLKNGARARKGVLQGYYRKRAMGFSAAEATYKIVPGNEAETQRRCKNSQEKVNESVRKYEAHWGYPHRNPIHRHRQQMIRSGEWKAEEHPL